MKRSEAVERVHAASRERGCYCVDKYPHDEQPARGWPDNVPFGFCARCDRCGAPGHLRHYPGAMPVTGGLCDRHYRQISWTHPNAPVGCLVWMSVLLALGYGLSRLVG